MTANTPDEHLMNRREFLKWTGAGAAVLMLPGRALLGLAAKDAKDVWVFHGPDKRALMTAAMRAIYRNGALGKNVKNVALKVNAAWTRTPAQGANTHPELVDSFLEFVLDAGVKRVVVPEHPCRSGRESFPKSGILPAVEKHSQKMIDLGRVKKSFRQVELPKARKLTQAQVAAEFLEADAVVNIPVAKHHSGAKLTMAMKNWMGAVRDRGFWHRNDLHQCIADFSTFIKPTWTIIDATRTMMDSGPQGPARKLKTPNLLIVSKDQVAADAYASRLFHSSIDAVKYLRIAREMRLGETDIAKMSVHKVDVPA